MTDMQIDSTPPAAAGSDIDPDLAYALKRQADAVGTQREAEDRFSSDVANFDPAGAAGPQPTFNEEVPKDHFDDLMKQAPLLLGLGAIGGAFGRVHGIAMIQSTNAMMKGLVQGNEDGYQKARADYDAKYQQFQEKSRTWNDVYKAYLNAYKGRIDADQKAVAAANAAVGIIDKDVNLTKKAIGDRVKLQAQIDNIHSEITHRSDQDVVAAMREQRLAQAAASKQAKDAGAKTAKEKKRDQDLSEAAVQIDKLIEQVQQNPTIVGGMGYVRRAGEVGGNILGLSNNTAANDFQSNMDALLLKLPKLLTDSSKSAGDERARVEQIARGLKLGSTPQNTVSSLQQLKELLGAAKGGSTNSEQAPIEKTVNGVTYVKTGPGPTDWAVKAGSP
jgi:hypothetical protein